MPTRFAIHLILALTLLISGVLAGLGHAHNDHERSYSQITMLADAAAPSDSSDHAGADQPDCQHAHCHSASLGASQCSTLVPHVGEADTLVGRDISLISRVVPVHERPPRLVLA